MLMIDGAEGEGGGQILRSSVALSMITGEEVRIENIRAGRQKPGLLQQHLTAVEAAAAISGAELEGARLRSGKLTFKPGSLRPGEYAFSIGTAGSTTLVLQTILPALITAAAPSRIILEGGTHNPHAPPFDFLTKAYLPLVARMGPQVSVDLQRHGFYPAGGGRLSIDIQPAAALSPITLTERGELLQRRCTGVVAGLPKEIAVREVNAAAAALEWPPECCEIQVLPPKEGPGNILLIEVCSERVTEVFTGFGTRGVRAETVAERAAEQALEYLAAGVPVGRYLADQLLLPMALARGGSFSTLPLSLHSQTNMQVIERFLDVRFQTRVASKDRVLVETAT